VGTASNIRRRARRARPNIVDLLFGLAGLVLACDYETARWYLVGGVIYLGLWLHDPARPKVERLTIKKPELYM
jgi:hypothetical protein